MTRYYRKELNVKMRTFHRFWSRILIFIASASLSLITFGAWRPHPIVNWIFICIPAILGIWGATWEHFWGDKRKLRRDSCRYKRFFAKWYNRPGELVICCGKLSWLTIHKGSNSNSIILDVLTLSNSRIAPNSILKIITADIKSIQLKELYKRLSPHNAIEIYEVEQSVIEKFSFSRYAAIGDAFQYIIKYNAEDYEDFITEHTTVNEKAFIDNFINATCINTKK